MKRLKMIALILALAVVAGWCGAQLQRASDQSALALTINNSFGRASADLENLDYCQQLVQSLYRAEILASLSEDVHVQDVGNILGKLAGEEFYGLLDQHDKQEFARLLDELRTEPDSAAEKAPEILALYQEILTQSKESD